MTSQSLKSQAAIVTYLLAATPVPAHLLVRDPALFLTWANILLLLQSKTITKRAGF